MRRDGSLKASFANKKTRATTFQVLLLNNDAAANVEVQEAEQVNFVQVKRHLKNGGSVFITSKDSQKQPYSSANAQRNYSRSRRTYGQLFLRDLRGS